MLAEWAGIAIDNARNYESSERRREELERTVRRLEATTAIARAVGGETDLDRILELIVDRGQALIEADGLVILLRETGGMVVAAEAGRSRARIRDPLGLVRGLPAGACSSRSCSVASRSGCWSHSASRATPRTSRCCRRSPPARRPRSRPPERRGERLRDAIHAAEEERQRWARELHDDTLQGLGGLRMLLVAASRSDDHERLRGAVRDTLARIDEEIDGLRGLIRELRPAALDELGLAAAIEGLAVARRRPRADRGLRRRQAPPDTLLARAGDRHLSDRPGGADQRDPPRRRHRRGDHGRGERPRDPRLVTDDGHGFDPATTGRGLRADRHARARLAAPGRSRDPSSAGGTTIAAAIPCRQPRMRSPAARGAAGALYVRRRRPARRSLPSPPSRSRPRPRP